MTSAQPTPHLLTAADLPRASRLLAEAYMDDPLMCHLLPDRARRSRSAVPVFGLLLGVGSEAGVVHASSERLECVAAWIRPGQGGMGFGRILRHGGLALGATVGVPASLRLLRFSGFAEQLQERCLPQPHHYLSLIGTDPAHRGEGHAGFLLASMTREMDEAAAPCFLETNNPENVPLYEKHGFRVAERTTVPRAEVEHFAMVRMPA